MVDARAELVVVLADVVEVVHIAEVEEVAHIVEVVVLADVVELHASFFDLAGAQILKMLGVHDICVVVMECVYLQVCCL